MIRLVVFLVVVFMAGPAWASTTSSVGSPKVKAGATEIAVRTGFSMADDESSEDSRFRSRIHIDHGFNDTYSAKIVFSQDNRKGDNFEHDGIKFENRFHILKADDVGFDAGIRLNYSHKDGDKKTACGGAGVL